MSPRPPALLLGALAAALTAALAACDADPAREAREPVSAAALYVDYDARRGADLLERYDKGVTVRGTVIQSLDLGPEGHQIALAASPGRVLLRFRQPPTATIDPGHEVLARCRIGGMPDDVLYLIDCLLLEQGAAAPRAP